MAKMSLQMLQLSLNCVCVRVTSTEVLTHWKNAPGPKGRKHNINSVCHSLSLSLPHFILSHPFFFCFSCPPLDPCVEGEETVECQCRPVSLPFHVKDFYCATIDFFFSFVIFFIWRYKRRKGRARKFKWEHIQSFDSPETLIHSHTPNTFLFLAFCLSQRLTPSSGQLCLIKSKPTDQEQVL